MKKEMGPGPRGEWTRDKSDRQKASLSVSLCEVGRSAFWDARLPVWCLWDGLIHIASSLPWALIAPHRDIKEREGGGERRGVGTGGRRRRGKTEEGETEREGKEERGKGGMELKWGKRRNKGVGKNLKERKDGKKNGDKSGEEGRLTDKKKRKEEDK